MDWIRPVASNAPWTGSNVVSYLSYRYVGTHYFEENTFLLKRLAYRQAVEPNLPYYSPISGWRRSGFLLFLRALARSETQTVTSKIWTRVIEFISHDNYRYSMNIFLGTYKKEGLTKQRLGRLARWTSIFIMLITK